MVEVSCWQILILTGFQQPKFVLEEQHSGTQASQVAAGEHWGHLPNTGERGETLCWASLHMRKKDEGWVTDEKALSSVGAVPAVRWGVTGGAADPARPLCAPDK